jgi:hypothetical protein
LDIKRIAALTGVIYYLREEELSKERENTHKMKGVNTDTRALYGRQMIMSGRDLVQRRIFARSIGRTVVNASVSGRMSRSARIRNFTGNFIKNMIRSRSSK